MIFGPSSSKVSINQRGSMGIGKRSNLHRQIRFKSWFMSFEDLFNFSVTQSPPLHIVDDSTINFKELSLGIKKITHVKHVQ